MARKMLSKKANKKSFRKHLKRPAVGTSMMRGGPRL